MDTHPQHATNQVAQHGLCPSLVGLAEADWQTYLLWLHVPSYGHPSASQLQQVPLADPHHYKPPVHVSGAAL
jgi:hypothetical protein